MYPTGFWDQEDRPLISMLAIFNRFESNRCLDNTDEVDEINGEVHRLVKSAIRNNPEQGEHLINLLLISRHLERIADHATNIAEEVIYMIEGEIVRHGDF